MPHILSTDSKLLQSNGQAGTATVITNHYVSGDGTVNYPVGLTFEPSDLMTNTSSWKPTVDSSGNLSWTLTDNTDAPATVNIKGETGPQGEQGPQGPAGADGAQGPQGVPGVEGPQGIQGERGPAGLQGPQGEQGPSGQDGKSAYEIAVDDGFTGTIEEWLESLQGPSGPSGADGKSAYEIAVEAGFTGTSAEWLDSLVGPEGPSGAQGPSGASGFSPTVSTTQITTGTSGTQVTITDLTGSHTFDIMNGAKGDQGPSGESYTGDLMPLIGDNGIAVTSNAGNAVVEISSVAHDNTISGNGTVSSPLGVIGGGGGGKTYTGVAPIVVNNNEDKISADCIELRAGNGIDSTKLATGVIEVSSQGGGSSDFSAAVTGDTRGAHIARNGALTNTIYTRVDDGSYHLTGVLNRDNLNNADMGYTMPQPYSNITGALTSVKISGITGDLIATNVNYSAIGIYQESDNSHIVNGFIQNYGEHVCGYLMPSAWSTLSGTVGGGSNFASSAFGIIPSTQVTALTSLSYYDTGIGKSNQLSGNNTNNLGWTMPSAYANVKNDIITETMPEVSSHYSYKLSYTSPSTGFTANSGLEIRKYVGNTGTTRKVLSGNSTLGELVPEDYTSRQYLATNAAGNMVWDDIANISPIVLVATSGDIPASGASDNKVYIVTGT